MPEPQRSTLEPEFLLPDVNVLVALTNPSHQHHVQARQWLSTVECFATTPLTENCLIRLLMNPAVIGQAVTGEQAIQVLTALRANPRATFVPDFSSLADSCVGLAGYRQATDFHLVNLAAHSGGVLVTFDSKVGQALTLADRKFVRVLA
jgi:toxin-antitoxin system PIN domain toxin